MYKKPFTISSLFYI